VWLGRPLDAIQFPSNSSSESLDRRLFFSKYLSVEVEIIDR
jgi:hypothetical protein